MAFLPSEPVGRHFTMADLTVTNQNVPNIPDDDQQENLRELGRLLDQIIDRFGPMTVFSAFRSPEVNALVGGSETSLHSQGMAVDLVPVLANYRDVFAEILSDPSLRSQFGEIILKTPQGCLHLSLPTFSLRGVPKIQERDSVTGILTYRRMTKDEIASYVNSESSAEEIESEADSEERKPYLIGGGTFALALSAFAFLKLKQSRK